MKWRTSARSLSEMGETKYVCSRNKVAAWTVLTCRGRQITLARGHFCLLPSLATLHKETPNNRNGKNTATEATNSQQNFLGRVWDGQALDKSHVIQVLCYLTFVVLNIIIIIIIIISHDVHIMCRRFVKPLSVIQLFSVGLYLCVIYYKIIGYASIIKNTSIYCVCRVGLIIVLSGI